MGAVGKHDPYVGNCEDEKDTGGYWWSTEL